MKKMYIDIDVYEATQERLAYIFKEFDNVMVAFSGGKDSGVLFNLAYDYAKKINQLKKVAMYHLDYEAQYQMTTDYVEETFKVFNDIKRFWLCLPIKAQCSTSMKQNYWVPWEREQKEIWVRDMPEHDYIINENNCQFDYDNWDYEVQNNFCNWFAEKHGKTAVLIGIRTQESLNRQAAITSANKVNQYKGKNYITKKDLYYATYPLYDWQTEDIWIANAKFGYEYNKLYDLFYQAGLTINEMRVASPFNDYAQASLKLYKVIDPQNWGRMIGRVNGVNFTAIYGGTTAMGWRSIKKPDHFTWKQYMYFLLDTLPDETRENYLRKLEASKNSWRVGGARDEQTIQELLEEGAPVIVTDDTNNRGFKDKRVIKFDDYLDDTNVTDFKRVPSYKRMCICIMKNDTTCKYMGFAQTKEEITKRRRAEEKYAKIIRGGE